MRDRLLDNNDVDNTGAVVDDGVNDDNDDLADALHPNTQRKLWKTLVSFGGPRGGSCSEEDSIGRTNGSDRNNRDSSSSTKNRNTRRRSDGYDHVYNGADQNDKRGLVLTERIRAETGASRSRKVPFEIELAAHYIQAGVHGRPLDFAETPTALCLRRIYHSDGWKTIVLLVCISHTLILCVNSKGRSASMVSMSINLAVALLYTVDALLYLVSFRWRTLLRSLFFGEEGRARVAKSQYHHHSRSGMWWAVLRLVIAFAIAIDALMMLARSCADSVCFLPSDSLRPFIGVVRLRHVRNIFVDGLIMTPPKLLVLGSMIVCLIVWSGVFGFLLLADEDGTSTSTNFDTIGSSVYQLLTLFICPPQLLKIEGPFMTTDKAYEAALVTVGFIIFGRLLMFKLITATAVGAFKKLTRAKVVTLLRRRHDAVKRAYRILQAIAPSKKATSSEIRAHEDGRIVRREDKSNSRTTRVDGVSARAWRQLYVWYKRDLSGVFGDRPFLTQRLSRWCGDVTGAFSSRAGARRDPKRLKLKANADAFFDVVLAASSSSNSEAPRGRSIAAPAGSNDNTENSCKYALTEHKTSQDVSDAACKASVEWRERLRKRAATMEEFFELCYFLEVRVHHDSRTRGVLSHVCAAVCGRRILKHLKQWRIRVRRVVLTSYFAWIVDALVFLSVVQICASSGLGKVGSTAVGNDVWMWGLGYALMWVFTIEIVLKIWSFGPVRLYVTGALPEKHDNENAASKIPGRFLSWFDLVTVICSFVSYVIYDGGLHIVPRPHTATNSQTLRAIYACRIFRLMRLIKRAPIPGFQQNLFIAAELLPAAARALCVYGAVVFFFTNFGFWQFQDHLTTTSVSLCTDPPSSSSGPPGGFDSKDVAQWCAAKQSLNFENFGRSLLTMFNIINYGNWKVTMEAAAAATDPYKARIFFFTYEFCCVVVCVPVLMGYIIQIYLASLARFVASSRLSLQHDQVSAPGNSAQDHAHADGKRVDTETSSENCVRSPAMKREAAAVANALDHRHRIRRLRRNDPHEIRSSGTPRSGSSSSSSSSSDDDSSSSTSSGGDVSDAGGGVENDFDAATVRGKERGGQRSRGVRRSRGRKTRMRPQLTWQPGYGEGQIALFGDLITEIKGTKRNTKKGDIENMYSEGRIDGISFRNERNLLETAASAIVSSREEVAHLRRQLKRERQKTREMRRAHRRSVPWVHSDGGEETESEASRPRESEGVIRRSTRPGENATVLDVSTRPSKEPESLGSRTSGSFSSVTRGDRDRGGARMLL
eukprot:g2114.t1